MANLRMGRDPSRLREEMNTMKIIVDNTIPYLKGVVEEIGKVTYLPAGGFTAEAVRDAEVLIVRSIDKCSREILEGSRVKLITTATIGFDHIDTAYCDVAGIAWRNAPGSNARSVAEYILTALIRVSMHTGEPLKGKTLGIVGVGHVGTKVEKLCRLYGMRILRNDPPRAEKEGPEGFVSLETITQEADIISLHTPLTRGGKHPTYHLADMAFVESLARKPWVINSCRGAVTETEALLRGKEKGTISQLIIDCWEGEPHISLPLLAQTAMATPHIAGFSADGKANASRMCLEEIGRFYGIEIPHLHRVIPPHEENTVIDLDRFGEHRIEEAILSVFDPLGIDFLLRRSPDRFEAFRNQYHHPREFNTYSITHATEEEKHLLSTLGFRNDKKIL